MSRTRTARDGHVVSCQLIASTSDLHVRSLQCLDDTSTDLSPIGLREAVRVFRCSACNRVTSAEMGSPILLRKRAAGKA